MSLTTIEHPRIASRGRWNKVRVLALLALALVGATALVLVSPWTKGHIAQARGGLNSVAAHSRALGPGARSLPATYRRFPESKLVALGIVRNPKTGLWMCVRAKGRGAAPSSHYSRVAFRP